MRNRWRRMRQASHEEGQGLIELTLVLPVLLLLFLGLIELGLALRAQLVLVNANREAARFAARGTFTDQQIADRALVAFSGQLPVTTDGSGANTGIIITRFHIPADPGEQATYDTPVYATGALTHTSKINPAEYELALKTQNDAFNDQLLATHKDAVRTTNDVVVVEIYYYHNQLLHAPIVEWIFPEPMVLYSWTTMRIGANRVR